MTVALTSRARRLAVLTVALLLTTASAATFGASQAHAYNPTGFCTGVIPNTSVCHAAWYEGVSYVANEQTSPVNKAVCVTLQGYSGGYYNIYEWACADGHILYSFPGATNGIPTVDNPNTTSYSISFDPYFG
jgi:hypothetical protein